MKAAVFRTGAFGDLLFASSVFAGLKKQGYHVTLYAAKPSMCIVENDPNIDEIIEHDSTIKQEDLAKYWKELAKKYDKFINLSGTIEQTFLQLPGSTYYEYPYEVRKMLYNKNYLHHQHLLALVPDEPNIKFYPNQEEIQALQELRDTMPETKILAWVIAGSAIHKFNPHIATFIANIQKLKHVRIVLIGHKDQAYLAEQVIGKDRVTNLTELHVRDQYTFVQQHCDVVIGPETGIMVAMSQEPMKKIVLLSHSTEEMLTKDWINTTSVEADMKDLTCGGCCKFRLSEGNDVVKHPGTEFACCQTFMPMWKVFESAIQTLES